MLVTVCVGDKFEMMNCRRHKVTNILMLPKFATIENKPNSCNIDSSMRNNDEFIHGFNGITVDFTSATFFRFSFDDISTGWLKNLRLFMDVDLK